MGNCCNSENSITGVVVYDPVSDSAARVEISLRGPQGILSICCAMGSSLMNVPVLRLQKKTVPEHWRTIHVFCEDPQAVTKTYNIHPNDIERPPQEWVGKVDFGQLWHPKKSTDRALYLGPIPNQTS